MIGFLILLLHVLISPFKMQARLEAEIVLLRHQLSVLRQRAPSRPKLTEAGRSHAPRFANAPFPQSTSSLSATPERPHHPAHPG